MSDSEKPKLPLGEFIAYRRQSLGYKKGEFSKMVGVGDDSLRSWEKGRFIPAGKNMRALIKLLNITPPESHYYFKTELYG